ncbi:DUF1302 family protein [Saccharospirillum impatiens]|uniref:DUF1302 family protein n=1 Tax=Saccharospirillum impatiens TaxID=169438 RepID=UPI00040D4010|nr:DUF1302 family protein [Saccharospirillum impatiens]
MALHSARLSAISLALVLPCLALAEDDFFSALDTQAEPETPAPPGPVQWLGWAQQKVAYGYRAPEPGPSRDRAALTRVESQLYGQMNARHEAWSMRLAGSVTYDALPDLSDADAWETHNFTDKQAEERRWHGQWADSYVGWQDGNWWLKAGYQTLAWGEAESLIVTDVLARRDQRWPGQQDLEQTRLPVPAITLNWAGKLDLAVLGWAETDLRPAPFDDFDQLAGLRANGIDIRHNDADNPVGVALRWQQRWPGLDLTWIAADVNAFESTLSDVSFNGAVPETATFTPERRRVLGANAQLARGSWLLKTEQGWHQGVRHATNNTLSPWVESDQWRAMLGADYSGFRNLTLTLELGSQLLLNPDAAIEDDEVRLSQSVRARYTTWNNRLELTAQGVNLPGESGQVVRLAADWQVSDPFSMGISLVDYLAQDSDQALYTVRHQDAAILNLRYGF